jgi:hypothetical protein
MHVQLKSTKYILESGKRIPYYPGDWVKVSRQTAQQWIAAGEACIPGLDNAEAIAGNIEDCGILMRGDVRKADHVRKRYPKLAGVTSGKIRLPFRRTLIWDPERVTLAPEQALVGFAQIDRARPEYAAWEMAIMLLGPLAKTFGDKEEREKTRKVIGTLDVPVYNSACFWVRKTGATERFISAWVEELEGKADERHAFLRALFRTSVIWCNLPLGWVDIR